MPFVARDFSTMVEAVLDRIVATNVGLTDKGQGSVLRTIVEALVAEIDIEYYQLGYIYDGIDPDLAVGTDLDRLVAILGVIRNQATTVTGVLTFSRSTPATSAISIPFGSIVGTRQDQNGKIIEVKVTDTNKIMAIGTTSIDVNIVTIVPGVTYLTSGKLCVMSNPIIGIESVTNSGIIDGGSDIETDMSLRGRTKLALSGLGKGTLSSLESAVRSVPGVIDVFVIDQPRGIATTDISVVCATMPPITTMIDAINLAVINTKAAGIDVAIAYPTVVTVNISITLTKGVGYDVTLLRNSAGSAMVAYLATLGIGDSLIITQLQRSVLDSNVGILDINTVAPIGNITATNMQILRVGTVIIDGVVW